MSTDQLRFYAWIPRQTAVLLQALIDAHEGVARIRTERHDRNNRSLLLFMVHRSRVKEWNDLCCHLQQELDLPMEFI